MVDWSISGLDLLDDWGGMIVAVRIIASAVVAYCVGYLIGQSRGYREGIRDLRPRKTPNYNLGVDLAEKEASGYPYTCPKCGDVHGGGVAGGDLCAGCIYPSMKKVASLLDETVRKSKIYLVK